MANNYVFGANLIENLTTGMYTNSLVIFREYIQNSCDAIDKARANKISAEDKGEVEITIDADARRITIEDDGTGISVLDFKSTLTSIAASDKNVDSDRGFRGIGRLCGVAYCRELRFVSTAKGEVIQSVMTIDAAKLRSKFYAKEKFKAEELLDESITFGTELAEADEHFFRVELIDIVDTNSDLLDVKKIREYLSFVAPVTYSPQLYYQTEIYNHAAGLNFKISEYKILVNGELLDKPYKINIQTRMGKDEIFGVAFRDFYDGENLIAWSWIGLSNFKGVLDQTSGTADNMMRGIRLRAENIQIGDEEALKNLFKEARGTNYFIGEVHAVDKNLIPNGRRDYFVENETCKIFESKLKTYFAELHGIYHTASEVRSAYKAIKAPADAAAEFAKQSDAYKKSHQAEHDAELLKLKKSAATKKKELDKIELAAKENLKSPLSRVVLRMTKNQSTNNPPPSQPPQPLSKPKQFPPVHWRRDKRELYHDIEGIILDNPKLAGKILLDKIKEELAK